MHRSFDDSEVCTRIVVESQHANINGALFGGFLMCWIDEIAFICARKFLANDFCATQAIDHISFRETVHLGEALFFRARVLETDEYSVRIEVHIDRESLRDDGGGRRPLNTASLIVGNFDQFGAPKIVPRFLTAPFLDDSHHSRNADWIPDLRIVARAEPSPPGP